MELDFANFNPRSREGSDRKLLEIRLINQPFQSTLPRGERQQICTIFYYDIGISTQYYYMFLNKNNLMNTFITDFNRFYYIFLVRISLHLHVKLLFAPHNIALLTIKLMAGQPRALCQLQSVPLWRHNDFPSNRYANYPLRHQLNQAIFPLKPHIVLDLKYIRKQNFARVFHN